MSEAFRSVMEVLKWVEPRTTLQATTEVSRLWKQVCNSSELWREYIDTEDLTQDIDPDNHCLKSAFREAYISRNQSRIVLPADGVMGRYDCKRLMFVQMFPLKSFRVDRFSAIVSISHKVVMVCGGVGTAHAQMYSLPTQEVTDLPDMFDLREYHSAIHYNRTVYVFGGHIEPASKAAECFHIKENQWRQLPDMLNSRCCFNACRKNQMLYLCGGLTQECEMFDTATYQYTSLPHSLPESNWTVSFFYHNQLVSIVKDNFYYLEPEGWKREIVKMPYIALGTSSALVYGDFVYISMVSCSVILVANMKKRSCYHIDIPD